jgi:uncharacterized membrane protein
MSAFNPDEFAISGGTRWERRQFLLYLIVVVITMAVNVPRNDRIKAAGEPDDIADLRAVRAAFDEARWVRWNAVRTLLSLGTFGCGMWALVEFGRTL